MKRRSESHRVLQLRNPHGQDLVGGTEVPRMWGPGIILLAAAMAVAPQLVRGNSCGHDFDFHLVSWFDAANSWRHGVVYPHWAPSPNFGAGEPRFVFYPPLTWMLAAALGLALPWQLVPIALTFLMLFGTGVATRTLTRQMLGDPAATLAGCTAIFSGYALFTAYERAAFGELAGGFWLPLLLVFALRQRNPGSSFWRSTFDGSAVPLTIVVAGCWLSNVPVGVMGCYLLAAVALVTALMDRSWAPIVRAATSTTLGTALAGIYLVPAVWEQRWVDVHQAIDDPGLTIENSWLFARHADPALADHDIELRKISIVAVSMIAVAFAGLVISWWRRRNAKEVHSSSGRWWIPITLIPLAVLLLELPLSLPLWNLLPKLRFLQFPWRWLVALEAPMAIFFAAAVWPRKPRMRVAVAALCVAGFVGATVYAGQTLFQTCDGEDSVSGMVHVDHSGTGFVGYSEYAPPGADDSMISTGLPDACLASDPTIVLGATPNGANGEDAILAWNAAQGSCEATMRWQVDQPEHRVLRGFFSRPEFLILHLRSYPAWRILLNGRPVTSLPRRADGLAVLPVPQGPVVLSIDWITTQDVLAGRWLSALAVLLVAGLWRIERKLGRSHL